jgi:hypothetical protein
MTEERVFFSGKRWASARIVRTQRVPSMEGLLRGAVVPNVRAAQASPAMWSKYNPAGRGAVPPGLEGEPTPCSVYTLSVTDASSGRHWATTEPQGFWRSFAALNFIDGDGSDVLRFTQRHGDLNNILGPKRPVDTSDWVAPAINFAAVAAAWEPAGSDDGGVSYLTTNEERLRVADATLRTVLLPAAARACDHIPDPVSLGLTTRALNMAAYMAVSAASALRRGVQMRRCRTCSDWYEPRRDDQQHCSASCRAAYAAGRAVPDD